MEKSKQSPKCWHLGEVQHQKLDIETADQPSGSNQESRKPNVKKRHRHSTTRKKMNVQCTNLDDGYSWRKYGQKQIVGSKFHRAYLRCNYRNTMGCQARKQIQRDDDDPNTFHVTYRGDHTCRQQEKSPNIEQYSQLPHALAALRIGAYNKTQYEALNCDLHSAAAFDIADSNSHEKYLSEITSDFVTKYEQSRNDQPSRIHDVLSGRTSDSNTRFHNPQNKANQQAAKRLEFTDYILGMTKNKEAVVSLLQSDSGWEHNVSVVSIVGAEGAGKTTLARLAYDDAMVCEAFELRSWICLTRINNIEELLRAMIKALTKLSCHPIEELSELQEIVKEEVTNRKYLLVLDNIRDVQILGSPLLTPLRFGGKGSKILVTAKEELTIDTTFWMTQSYKLDNLSEHICLGIMNVCAFYNRDPSGYPDINKVWPAICQGNPLAARVTGGVIRAKVYDPLISLWDVLNYKPWESKAIEDKIRLALEINFDALPDFLKKCLVYCSLFPKGYIFEKNYLIRLWMAQGYIEPQRYEEAEEIGSEHLNELLCRSFLQHSRNPNFSQQCYEMHDFVYELLQIVVCEKNYEAHTVSFLSDKSGNHEDFEALEVSRYSQSLLIDRHLFEYCGRKKIRILSTKILSYLLDNIVYLNALDLSFSNIKDLPDSIEKLMHLRYLGLNETSLRKLPTSLCNLYNLQTLELQDCLYLRNLPEEINKLVNLRHLDTRKKSGCIGIPRGLGRLTRLRTLLEFSIAEEKEWHSGISELKDLVNLRGYFCIGGLRHVTDDKEAQEAHLSDKKGLVSLTLQWSTSGRGIEDDEMDVKANKVFENLKPHEHLRLLVVRDYSGDQFPAWIGNPSLSRLISITLDNCRWCKKLPPLGLVTSLKHLFIRRMDSLQSMGREFLGNEGLLSDWIAAFPSLETLKIWEMYNLEEWYGVKGEDFPRLRNVSISRCFKLWSLPCLPALVKLTIHGGVEVPLFSYFPSLESLSIQGFHSLKTLRLQPGLTSVLKLEVTECSQLSSLLGFRYSKTLREIKLDKCPILDLESDELPLTLEVVDIHHSCSLLCTWCPPGFHENINFCQAIGRRLVREKQQDHHVNERYNWLTREEEDDEIISKNTAVFKYSIQY